MPLSYTYFRTLYYQPSFIIRCLILQVVLNISYSSILCFDLSYLKLR
jgi:hypothetical protein